MKRIVWIVILLLAGLFSLAQSKQLQVYLEQIAANADFLLQMKKSISIAKEGLTTISDIRNGEFKLHDLFFKGLSSVNPKIRNWSKVGDIIDYQVNIVKSYKAAFAQIKASGQFTSQELDYSCGVFSKLLDNCADIIEMLADVLADGNLKMSDDERIKRIDVLYANMQSNYKFLQQFSNNNLALAMHRNQEQNESEVSKKLFDIH